MPIVNGRVHVHRRPLATHHRAAYGIGVGAAVLIVAVGWVFTVGSQVRAFFDGARASMDSASATISQAQSAANAIAVPAVTSPAPTVPLTDAFVPALQAVLKKP